MTWSRERKCSSPHEKSEKERKTVWFSSVQSYRDIMSRSVQKLEKWLCLEKRQVREESHSVQKDGLVQKEAAENEGKIAI